MSVTSKLIRLELDADLQRLLDKADSPAYRMELLLIQLLRELKRQTLPQGLKVDEELF